MGLPLLFPLTTITAPHPRLFSRKGRREHTTATPTNIPP